MLRHEKKEEELEYLRVKLEKEKETRSRAIDKALMDRELEAVKRQAGAARTTIEVTLQDSKVVAPLQSYRKLCFLIFRPLLSASDMLLPENS